MNTRAKGVLVRFPAHAEEWLLPLARWRQFALVCLLAVLAILHCPPLGCASAATDDLPTVDSILKTWEKRAAAINSARFTWFRRQQIRGMLPDDRGLLQSELTCKLLINTSQ